MLKCLQDAAAKYEVTVEGKTTRASVEANIEREYSAMDVPDSSHVVQLVINAAARLGMDVKTMASVAGATQTSLTGTGSSALISAPACARFTRSKNGLM